MCMIVSDTDTVLIYEQTKLRWSAKLSHHPCIINRASFKVCIQKYELFVSRNKLFVSKIRCFCVIYLNFFPRIRPYKDVWFCCRKLVIWDCVIWAPTQWYLWLQKDRPKTTKTPRTSWFSWKRTFKTCLLKTVTIFEIYVVDFSSEI